MKAKNFIFKLFFTRDDDLDVLQVLFTAIIVVSLLIAWNIMLVLPEMSDPVKIEALVTLRWLAGLLVLTAVPKWLVPAMVTALTKGKLGGDKSTPPTPTPEEPSYDVPTEDPS